MAGLCLSWSTADEQLLNETFVIHEDMFYRIRGDVTLPKVFTEENTKIALYAVKLRNLKKTEPSLF